MTILYRIESHGLGIPHFKKPQLCLPRQWDIHSNTTNHVKVRKESAQVGLPNLLEWGLLLLGLSHLRNFHIVGMEVFSAYLTPNGVPISCRSNVQTGQHNANCHVAIPAHFLQNEPAQSETSLLCIKYFGLATLPWHYRYSCVGCFATVPSLQNKQLAVVIFTYSRCSCDVPQSSPPASPPPPSCMAFSISAVVGCWPDPKGPRFTSLAARNFRAGDRLVLGPLENYKGWL